MAWEMDEIDSKYIVLKYYVIPETASNPSFSIVIVKRVKYKSAGEIATRQQGDTRREERKSLFTATLSQSLVCFTTIYRFIFLWTTLSDICVGKNIRISVPLLDQNLLLSDAPNREDGHPCILTMGDPSPQACPFRSPAHKQTDE